MQMLLDFKNWFSKPIKLPCIGLFFLRLRIHKFCSVLLERRIPKTGDSLDIFETRLRKMPKCKDEDPAVRVYTVCDESKYLIVRNVPELGCGNELLKLFSTYGEVEECKPMDGEECEPFTDVYWIKFRQINNARFAKRKLDEYVFLGNRLQISYAHQYESLLDTREKLEGRRKEVLARLNPRNLKGSSGFMSKPSSVSSSVTNDSFPRSSSLVQRELRDSRSVATKQQTSTLSVPFNKEYFPSQSMNQTVQLVREKLDEIQQSSFGHGETSASKKMRVDNRRRI